MSKRPVASQELTEEAWIATLRKMYVTMLRIRRFEEKVAEVLRSGSEIICPVHLSIGQEAVAAGVCANLRHDDYAFSTHRSHAHYIAKGGDIKTLMAELHGRATGCSRGRGGSMHLASADIGFPGSSAIVAGTIPLATGAAMSFSLQEKDTVAVAFFGDGATNEGVFYESLNFASLKKLPVVFVCENNLYATHMPASSCLADTDIRKKAEIFNMPGARVDGNDATEVFQVSGKAIEDARRGRGPALIVCMTYRWLGHVGPNYDLDKGLRSKDELEHWMNRCPVRMAEKKLLSHGALSEAERDQIYQDIEQEVKEALAYARQSPFPNEDELLNNVFATSR